MNIELIDRLALEAGLVRRQDVLAGNQLDAILWRGTGVALSRFASLIAEECAKLADAERLQGPVTHADDIGYQDALEDAAVAIRAAFS